MPNPDRKRLTLPSVLTPDEFICFCIAIPDEETHIAAFWGALQLLANHRTWGKPLSADSFTVSEYWRDLLETNEATFMADTNCGCCPDPIFRYGIDGIQEISEDGGETWQDFLGDPRMSGTILPPPPWLIIGADNKCDGATTARLNMEQIVDGILNSGETTIVNLIAAIVASICALTAGTVCAVAALVGVLAGAIVSLGATAFEGAMTLQVYDAFMCILFCHIEDDASFTEAGWNAVKSDVLASADIPLLAETMLWNIVQALGPVGLTNIARNSIIVDSDCSSCVCDPCDSAFAFVGTLVDHPSEFVWEFASADDGFGQQAILVRFGAGGVNDCCCIANVEMIGFAPFESYRACGSGSDTGGNPGAAPINQYRRNTGVGGAGFGMILTLEACPEE